MLDKESFNDFKNNCPIIVDKRWLDCPEGLRKLCIEKRLSKDNDDEMCTDVEAIAYLSSASLSIPFSNQWYRIYMYLFHKEFKSLLPQLDDEFKSTKKLSETENNELLKLKRWIYTEQLKEFKKRNKGNER